MATTEHLQPSVVLGMDVVKTVGAPGGGVHGYSSSGHSDASHHPNGVANVNSTDTSRQVSLEAAVAGASATVHVPPSVCPVPAALDVAVDVQQSGTPSCPAEPAYTDPAAVAAGAVKQELDVSAIQQEAATSLAAVKDELEAPGSPAAAAEPPVHSTLPPLSPLPAPDGSEPPEVHAEYALYMDRFKAGDTLAQRWHRLAEKGKLEDIQEEWEEWQQDLMLQKLQAQIQAADKGRKRKQVDSDLDPDAPRQTRNRRAPSNLQDYQVEAPASSGPGAAGVRETTPGLVSGRPTGASNGRVAGEKGSDDLEENYSEEPEQQAAAAGRASRGGQQHQQQQRGSRGAYRPPPPVVTQQPRGGTQHLQQQAWEGWQQQQPAEMMGAVAQQGMSQELMSQLYQMGTAMGAALQNSGASGAAAGQGAAVPSAGAMQAALEMCTRMWGSDPAAFAQQMQAFMQQAHH